ncbi:MAG: ATP-binding protein [Pseudomonadota bacterium]
MANNNLQKVRFKLGIVGGGRACEYFLNLLETTSFPYLDLTVSGVCDINPEACGMVKAQSLGIPTFKNFTDFFNNNEIDAVIELTNNKSLPELMNMRPERVGVIEHNIGRLLRNLFEMHQNLMRTREQAVLDKGYYDILFQQTNLGVVVLDHEFNIVDANKVYLKACQKTRKEVLGNKCYKIIKGFYAPCPYAGQDSECPLIKTRDTGKPFHMIHEYALPNGDTSYFNVTAYPIWGLDNKVTHIIELWQDITTEMTRKWENRVKQLHSDMKKIIQEDRLVSLGKLVASSVHEINNPIQGILTFSCIIQDMLQKENPDNNDLNQIRNFNLQIIRELERCGDIVSGLLAFSRESPLEFVNTDVNEILQTVLVLTRHKLQLSNIGLAISICPSPLIVYGDKSQLQQCFLNIIFNAIEAMPDGGKISISTGINQDKNSIWVEINDSGCGISKKNLEHVFDPFFTTKKEGGTGLGLSIVYGIVKDHKGDIQLESSLDTGTSFLISLPGVSFV